MKCKRLSALVLVVLLSYSLTVVLGVQYFFKTKKHQIHAGLELTSKTIVVPDDYPTIQEAINAASNGDTIFARSGTYYEHVAINKPLSLIGEDRQAVIVDGRYSSPTLEIISDNVTVTGLTLIHSSAEGLKLTSSCNCLIVGNIVENNTLNGILVECSSNNNTITNNVVQGNIDGIYLWTSSTDNVIFNNTVLRNIAYGMNIHRASDGNVVRQNCIAENGGCGIVIDSASHNLIFKNKIVSNKNDWYSLAGAIWFDYNCTDNTIFENNVENNAIGLSTWLLTGIGNKIYHNNFINNANQTFIEADCVWDNGYPAGGNYWSDYAGTDNNADGIGDTPYIIDANNSDHYPLMYPWTPPDIAVTAVIPHKTVVSPVNPPPLGMFAKVDVFVENRGNKVEGFNVTVYGNNTMLYPQERNVTLKSSSFAMLTFHWLTIGLPEYQNFTISAYAGPLESETNLTDNLKQCTIAVAHMGDVNTDGKVDIEDLARVSAGFASIRINDPQDPHYNQYWHPFPHACKTCPHTSNADINGDDKIDIQDLAMTSGNFGWHRP